MIKEKPCRGVNKAFGFDACGKNTAYRKYGLCMNCYPKFILNDERGKVIMAKSLILAKSKVNKENRLNKSKETQKAKIDLLSNDKYRSKYLQPIINEIARLIDYGQPCIATGNFGKMNGGHYVSVGANRTTALNLHNIHIQSFESNNFKGGDPIKYRHGIIERYGNDYFEFIEFLQQHPPLHLTKSDLIDLVKKATLIRNELKNNNYEKTPLERIEFRNQVNLKLGIYNPEFCEFFFL